MSTDAIANITLAVMGNLVDNTTPGAAGRVMTFADKALGLADPILRKTRAPPPDPAWIVAVIQRATLVP